MSKIYWFSLLLLCSCVQPKWKISYSSAAFTTPNAQAGSLAFIQSNDIIESRIAQDQFTRIWKYPATQAYVFMNKSYIDSLNLEAYKEKMRQQNISYILFIRIQESAEPIAYASFLEAYQTHFAKLMYNPVYKYNASHAFVHFSVFDVTTEKLLWQAVSSKVQVSELQNYLQSAYPKVQKELEKARCF
ncbi:MAG: hypothetical protein MH472_10255 [Bacteroidia bacterium]|nr:hypothetical protein [Bacteroidia bacterium]